MNRQEIFDKVVAHARKQGCKAFSEPLGVCMYRGQDNTKCFIGALIPDELYEERFEEHGICNVELKPILDYLGADISETNQYNHYATEDANFLSRLQNIHDDCDVEDWEAYFEKFAEDNNLVYHE